MMSMDEQFFTPAERRQVLALSRSLLQRHSDLLTPDDLRRVRDIIESGVEQGVYRRDRYGINPVLRHLTTAVLLTQFIAPDRNMVIATLIYNLCRGEFLTEEGVRRQFGNDIGRLVHGLLNVSQLYK